MKKILISTWVLWVVFTLMVVLMVVLGITRLFFLGGPTLDVRLRYPESVVVGEELDIVLIIRNLHQEEIFLDSIDVALDFLNGFEVVSIFPAPGDPMDFFGYRSWGFNESVLPGETLEVIFTVMAHTPGHYVGEMDVCNPNQNFTTVIPNIDILAE